MISNVYSSLHTGNIFLHLFMAETRELYDLETLWTVGPKYDRLSREMPDVPDFSWVDAYTSDFQQFGGINTSNQNNEDTRARTGPEEYSGKRNHKHQHNKTWYFVFLCLLVHVIKIIAASHFSKFYCSLLEIFPLFYTHCLKHVKSGDVKDLNNRH